MPDGPRGYTYHYYNPDTKGKNILISIDPGVLNNAVRVERYKKHKRRYKIKTLRMDLESFKVAKRKDLMNLTSQNIFNYLETLDKYIGKCRAILVEVQYVKNTGACKLAEFIKSYFMATYRDDCPSIIDVASQIKGSTLCDDPSIKGPKLKKWCVEKSYELLEAYGDYKTIELLDGLKKKDDVSDCVLMCECYRILVLGHKPF